MIEYAEVFAFSTSLSSKCRLISKSYHSVSMDMFQPINAALKILPHDKGFGTRQLPCSRNFRWCKISRNCMLALQKKFSRFYFRTFSRQDHTYADYLHVEHRTFSPPIEDFAVLIFTAPSLSVKNAKFCTVRKFPAIRYLLHVHYTLSNKLGTCMSISVHAALELSPHQVGP
jgi:hypothetical protein